MVKSTGWLAWMGCGRVAAMVWSLLLVAGWPTGAIAQDGTLDPTFGQGGKVITNMASIFFDVAPVALQSDGKIVVASTVREIVDAPSFIVLFRYHPNGSPDSTFGMGGQVDVHLNSEARASGIAIQTDGKIVVAGTAGALDEDFLAARLNPDGSLDSSFSGGIVTTDLGSTQDKATALAIQSDGKILVVGSTFDTATDHDLALVRYAPNGQLDPSFDGDGIRPLPLSSEFERLTDVALQSDGKIVAAGFSASLFANRRVVVVRLNGNGSLDTSFDVDGQIVTDVGLFLQAVKGLVIQPGGRIVVAGFANDIPTSTLLVGYQPNGALDGDFGNGGLIKHFLGVHVEDVAVQADSKIVVSGFHPASNVNFAVARFQDDGTIDGTFGSAGFVTTVFIGGTEVASGIAIQDDGRLVVAGNRFDPTSVHVVLARYEATAGPLPPTPHTLTYFLHSTEPTPSPDSSPAPVRKMSQTPPSGQPITLAAGDQVTWSTDVSHTGRFLTGASFRLQVPCAPVSQLSVVLTAVSEDLVTTQELAKGGLKGCTGPLTTITMPVTATLPVSLTNHTLRLTLSTGSDVEFTLGPNAFFEATRFRGIP